MRVNKMVEPQETIAYQITYCIKEMTKMLMELDARVKRLEHHNDNFMMIPIIDNFLDLERRMQQLERMV